PQNSARKPRICVVCNNQVNHWSQVTTHMRGHYSVSHAYAWLTSAKPSNLRTHQRPHAYASVATHMRGQARQASRYDAAST
ncbi:hypothetical protein PIB30_114854, partial [Stylosanthes scabra]|nr:hypothetical protein [Stylosanthes scabra]